MLLDSGRQRDHGRICSAERGVERLPPSGGGIYRKFRQIKAVREVNLVVLPACPVIDPKIPPVIGQHDAIDRSLGCACGRCQDASQPLLADGGCQRAGCAKALEK